MMKTDYDNLANASNGIGTGSTIYVFNNSKLNYEDDQFHFAPMSIAIGHEFIHAVHGLAGTRGLGFKQYTYDFDTDAFGMPQEEFQTRIEERKLEREQGLLLRVLPERLTKKEYLKTLNKA